MPQHQPDCAWTQATCEYKAATHHYCPHPQHACTCKPNVYVASRASVPERGEMWRDFRRRGVSITSSWIDEDGQGQTGDFGELWERIANEISDSNALVLYAENDDFPLKGALIEVGIAIGMGIPVIVCLPGIVLTANFRPVGSWVNHPLVSRVDDIEAAVALAIKVGE